MSVRELAKDTFTYFWGRLLAQFAPLVLLPILTRLFDREQYGDFSLYNVIVIVGAAFLSLGLPTSLVRFYHEHRRANLFVLYVTYVFFVAVVVLVPASIIVEFLPFGDPGILRIIFAIVFLTAVFTLTIHYLRVRQQIIWFNVLTVFDRTLQLVTVVLVLLIFRRDVYHYFLAVLIAKILVIIPCIFAYVKVHEPGLKLGVGHGLAAVSIKYGSPAMLVVVTFYIFQLGGRYVIRAYMDSDAVAVYSVAFDIIDKINGFLIFPFSMALYPIFWKVLEQKGPDVARAFASHSLRYFVTAIVPIVFVLCSTREQLLLLVGTEKYLESASLIPILLPGIFLYGVFYVVQIGLHYTRRTDILFFAVLISTLFNLAGNLLFVPRYGIVAAAWVTLASYVFLLATTTYCAFRRLPLSVPLAPLSRWFLVSSLAFLGFEQVELSNIWIALLVRGAGQLAVVGCVGLLLDREMRDQLVSVLTTKNQK